MDFLSPEITEFFIRLAVAMSLGLLIGAERVFAQKIAGMRTYALVSMGSALFVIIAQLVMNEYDLYRNLDPLRIASQIIVGLGFIGAGIIIFKDSQITGLTTAAGLWVAGGIGIAAGYGLYSIAIFATILTLFTFSIVWFLESNLKKLFKKVNHNHINSNDGD